MGTANNVGFCNDPTVEYRVRSSGWNNKYKCATYNYIDPNTGQNIPYIEGSNNNLMYRYEISFFEPEPVEPYKWCFRTKLDMGRGAMVWFNGNPVVIYKNSVRLSLIVAMDLLHTLLTHTLSLSLSPLSLSLSLSLTPPTTTWSTHQKPSSHLSGLVCQIPRRLKRGNHNKNLPIGLVLQ